MYVIIIFTDDAALEVREAALIDLSGEPLPRQQYDTSRWVRERRHFVIIKVIAHCVRPPPLWTNYAHKILFFSPEREREKRNNYSMKPKRC